MLDEPAPVSESLVASCFCLSADRAGKAAGFQKAVLQGGMLASDGVIPSNRLGTPSTALTAESTFDAKRLQQLAASVTNPAATEALASMRCFCTTLKA